MNLSYKEILIKLLTRFSGLLIAIFAVIYFLSLITFSIEDPSFNSYSFSQEKINNLFGLFGSHLADLSYQLIGISSFFLALIIFSIGLKISSKEGISHIFTKIILTPSAILLFSVFFASLPEPNWWYFTSLGGVNGAFLLAKIDFIYGFVTVITSLILSLAFLSIILEIALKDWVYTFRYFNLTLKNLLGKIFGRFFRYIPNLSINLGFNFRKNKKVSDKKSDEDVGNIVNNEDEESNFQPELKVQTKEDLKKQLKKVVKKIPKILGNSTSYQLPPMDLLIDRSEENKNKKIPKYILEEQSKELVKVLSDFGIKGKTIGVKVGPVITLHEFEPEPGTKAARIIGLSDDIARSMSAVSSRIAVIPGKTSIGIELPNLKREMIFLRELMECKEYRLSNYSLPMILGKNIGGEIVVADLARMPHLLIAGTTGSGKSVGLNVMILSLLFAFRPDECKFIMIDPKMLELSIYDGIPHLLSAVVTDPNKAVTSLKWAVAEMEERYRLMSSFSVRNIAGYNEKAEKARMSGEKLRRKVQTGYDPTTGQPIIEETEFEPKKMPFIVVIIDEMADLMLVAGKEIESLIQRLAQMARAAGIHIITATQRPSVDVITGVIKANFPTRISFQVTSRIDSRTILGTQGAEQLLGQGDMIYMSGGNKMIRVHGPFCSDEEIEEIVGFIKSQEVDDEEDVKQISFDVPIPDMSSDANFLGSASPESQDIYDKAVAIIKRDKKVSISYIQRQLRIGYNRAADLVERMEKEGVVSAPNVAGKRELLTEE